MPDLAHRARPLTDLTQALRVSHLCTFINVAATLGAGNLHIVYYTVHHPLGAWPLVATNENSCTVPRQ